MTNLINQLRSAKSIYEGRELLQGLKKADLIKLAKENNIYHLDTTKEKIINRILNSTIQSRLDWEAIDNIILK